jgi:outer membrane protein OmpA-like peptidoglycan-associated protein
MSRTRDYRGFGIRVIVFIGCCIIIAACASPPKPPVVDGTERRPVNSSETASMLQSQAEQSLAKAKERAVELERLLGPTSQTVMVHFPLGSADFRPTLAQEAILKPLLENAHRVEVRGRTDARQASATDEQLALRRAQAAVNYLVDRGIPLAKISVNYLSGGDHIADINTDAGRARNRRVEIEVFSQF